MADQEISLDDALELDEVETQEQMDTPETNEPTDQEISLEEAQSLDDEPQKSEPITPKTPSEDVTYEMLTEERPDQPSYTGVPEIAKGLGEVLSIPLQAVEAAVADMAESPGTIGQKLRSAYKAAADQFSMDPPAHLTYGDLITMHLMQDGKMPAQYAQPIGQSAGAIAEMGLDPLNFIGVGAKAAKKPLGFIKEGANQIIKGVAKEKPITVPKRSIGDKPSISDMVLGSMFRVKPQNLADMRRNRDKVFLARDPEAIRQDILEVVEKTTAELSDAKEYVKFSRNQLSDQKRFIQEKLKSRSITKDVVDDFNDALSGLKKEISEGSSAAFEILEAEGDLVDLSDASDFVRQKMLEIAGPLDPELLMNDPDYSNLAGLSNLMDLDDPILATEAKQVVQYLDNRAGPLYDKLKKGEYLTKSERTVLDLRRLVNDKISDIPHYREAMRPLAEKTKLLKDIQARTGRGGFGIFDGALRPEKGRDDLDLIKRFDKLYDTNFAGEVDEVARAKDAIKYQSKFDSIPEIAKAQMELAQAEADLRKKQQAVSALGGWSKGNYESISKRIMNGTAKKEWEEGLSVIDKTKYGVSPERQELDLAEELRLAAIKADFNPKGEPGGTRRVLLGGGGAGTAVQGLMEGDPAKLAVAASFGIGFMADIYGPVWVDKWLRATSGKTVGSTFMKTLGKIGEAGTIPLKPIAAVFSNPMKAYSTAPGITNLLLNPQSDLHRSGSVIISNPKEINEFRSLVLVSEMPHTEKAKILNALEGDYIVFDKKENKIKEYPMKGDKVDKALRESNINKMLRTMKKVAQ